MEVLKFSNMILLYTDIFLTVLNIILDSFWLNINISNFMLNYILLIKDVVEPYSVV